VNYSYVPLLIIFSNAALPTKTIANRRIILNLHYIGKIKKARGIINDF
jgi:hypothetical protein